MRGINKVILVGNLGQDPEVKYSPQGTAMANISVATTDTWNDKKTGNQESKTEWHRVVFFRRLAEIAGEYLKKGSKVYIEGKLQTRKWQDKNGQDRYTTEIVAREMQMLDNKGGEVAGNNAVQDSHNAAKSDGYAPPPSDAPPADFDDDIPFMRRSNSEPW